jgi:hypothetical protein
VGRCLQGWASLAAAGSVGAREVAAAWPGRGGIFTYEGSSSTVVTVGSRSEKDRSGTALIGGAMCGVRRQCGLLGDARCMAAASSSLGVQGSCAVVLAASMAGDVARHGPVLKTTLCAMWCVQEAASATEGMVTHNIDDVSLGGGTTPGS